MTTVARLETEIPGAPPGTHFAPRNVDDVVAVVKLATETNTPVRVWGGGTHQRMGREPPTGFVMSTAGLGELEHWEPEDLTLVAGAGIEVAKLEGLLAGKGQTAVLPERSGDSTLGGVLATGRSSLRRGRMLGTRERVLEITAVTGDGRIVRSGGRVVKNVSGYDLHRAMVGAFGSLGVIVSVCLKLWPVPPSSATVRVDSLDAVDPSVRPLALLGTAEGLDLFVWGTEDDVDAVVARTGGMARSGLHWPHDPVGEFKWSLRVPPALMTEAVGRVEQWDHLAIYGSGEVRLASNTHSGAEELRDWAEASGGSLVLVDHPPGPPPLDPWGASPSTLEIQRRLVAQFDPARIINPNRLPGGI